MFGKVQEVPQTETTPFWQRSPSGAAKMYAYWMTVNCAPWNASGCRFMRRNRRTCLDGRGWCISIFLRLRRSIRSAWHPDFCNNWFGRHGVCKHMCIVPIAGYLRTAAERFRIPRLFLQPRVHSARDMHAGFHSRDKSPSRWRVGWRILRGEYVVG